MVQCGQQVELVRAGRQVSDLSDEYHGSPGESRERQAVSTHFIGERNPARADAHRSQTGSGPDERARAAGAEAVTQHTCDLGGLTIQVVHAADDAVGQAFFIHLVGGGATGGNAIDCRVGQRNGFGFGEFRAAVEPLGWITDDRIECPAHFGQQHEGVAAAGTTRATCTGTRTGGGRLALQGRVIASLDRGLQALDVGQVIVGGRLWRLDHRRLGFTPVREHLCVERDAAIAAKGQLLTVGQSHRNRTGRSGYELLACIDPIAFADWPARSIARYREHFADNLTDDTNESSHDSILTTAADHRRHASTERARRTLHGRGKNPVQLIEVERRKIKKTLTTKKCHHHMRRTTPPDASSPFRA